ncbi:hypothetical protein B0H10DRAFT_1953428 [Mycena sp. CBHHK59/15]|nr:hypothetical protein B0H10DRAFT_1953428 [Mycena sp. CBHHK59/15]
MTDILTKGQSYLDGTTLVTLELFDSSLNPACTAVGHTISLKGPWIAHILGGRTTCPNASVEAKAEATAQRKEASEAKEVKKHPRSDTPDPTEPKAKKHQTQSTLTTYQRNNMLCSATAGAPSHRVVSGGLPLRAFREPEMLVLFGMLHLTAPEIMPTGKVVGGRLLDDAAEEVELKTEKVLKDKDAGLSPNHRTDGWKCKKTDSVNTICANVDYKSHLLELIEVTALNKDGTTQCELFEDMIDRAEKKFSCKIRYFTTDVDGRSKKGRLNLGKKRYWLILPSCWAHQFQLILGDYFKVNDMDYFSAHAHIVNGLQVQGEIKNYPCTALRWIYVPKDSSIRQVLIIHNDLGHNHPCPALSKVTFGHKDTYRRCIQANGVLGATVAKIDNDCQKGEKNAFFRAAGHSVSGAPIDGARGQIVLGSPENSLVTARHLDARQDVGSGRYSPGLAVGTVSWPISTKQEYERRQAFRYGGKTLVDHDREHTGAGLWHQD